VSEQERDTAVEPVAEAPAAPQPETPPPVAAASASERVAPAPPAPPAFAGPPADRPPRGDAGERRRRPFGRRKVCSFCVEKARAIDYKDVLKLRRYLSDRGRIESRRKTGTCAKHQRWLATALKRARHLAMLPYSPEHIRSSGAPVGRR